MAPLPIMLRPSGKDSLWGGSRLNDEFSKNIDMSPLAETWECSTHPDGPSFAASGEFEGKTLRQILSLHPEYMGTHPRQLAGDGADLPILIKFIDAREKLSVQVHPDDAYAAEHENGQRGKSEMWYVLDAKRGACLTYGLSRDIKKQELQESLADGTVEKYLQRVPVRKNDVFFMPAGTIHAIGAGVLVAEIQESSNLTYRLYDYDRIDKNGRHRELHVDKAMDVADLHGSAEPRQPLRVLKYRGGCASELLCRCKYFEVYRMLLNTERIREMAPFRADEASFRVLLCVDGCGMIRFWAEDGPADPGKERIMPFYKGDCIFVPANSAELRIHGQAQFLDVRG